MLEIKVGSLDGGADFTTLGEAVLSVPYDVAATITLAPGVYEEKVFCDKRHITICGAGAGKTILRWADGGKQIHKDGRPKKTFRSYTLFLGGEFVCVKNLTVQNTAGLGKDVGQGVAVYADATHVLFENADLQGRQDTLFCAPLPLQEREPMGFLGPRMLSVRNSSRQYYKNCRISGDIDFIFGGADAVFENCEIHSLDIGEKINGFVTAPSTQPEALGFVFQGCRFTSNCSNGSVYLGRPWREYGKTAVLNSEIGAHISPKGWCDWFGEDDEKNAVFAEYGNTGEGAAAEGRVPWARFLEQQQAQLLLEKTAQLKKDVFAEQALYSL